MSGLYNREKESQFPLRVYKLPWKWVTTDMLHQQVEVVNGFQRKSKARSGIKTYG